MKRSHNPHRKTPKVTKKERGIKGTHSEGSTFKKRDSTDGVEILGKEEKGTTERRGAF